jgi:nucleotide-binding universal stress UspA family protein
MNRIVVGVDGSEEARVALRWALHEARFRGAELMVAHVWQPLDLVVPPGTLSDPALDFQSDLETGASRVLDAAMVELGDDIEGIDVRTQLLDDGSVAGRLVDAATGAELLVVGSRGWGGVRGRLLGSVSQQCAHHTRCPLVILRRGAAAHGDSRNTIVVGVDGSPNSEAALHWALAEAERRGADVLALHAWSIPPTASIGYVPPTPFGAIRQAATACLEEVVRRASGPHPGVRCEQVVAEGAAGQALVDAAQGASLLVVGTRGRGGFAGLLLGSVSQQCAHHAPCPIVIVPSGR